MKQTRGRELEELFAAVDVLAQRWLAWRGSGGSDDSVSISEAAEELDIPERTLREWARLGRLETLPPRVGERGSRISAQSLEELRKIRRRSPRRGAALPRI